MEHIEDDKKAIEWCYNHLKSDVQSNYRACSYVLVDTNGQNPYPF